MNDSVDFAVIGGGIAGVSIASHLAEHARVALVEMEPQPGYHSTGRSVSLFCETYGGPVVRALTRASRRFYFEPPSTFCTAPLVTPRPLLMIASSSQTDALQEFFTSATPGDRVERLSSREAIEALPIVGTRATWWVPRSFARRPISMSTNYCRDTYGSSGREVEPSGPIQHSRNWRGMEMRGRYPRRAVISVQRPL